MDELMEEVAYGGGCLLITIMPLLKITLRLLLMKSEAVTQCCCCNINSLDLIPRYFSIFS